MNISFRQGILKYPNSNEIQNFLTINNNQVSINLANGKLLFTLAEGQSNYLIEIEQDVQNAWTVDLANINYLWLEFDKLSGNISFKTTVDTIYVNNTPPTDVYVGRVWFDKTTNKVKEYVTGNIWVEKVKILVARLHQGSFTPPTSFGNNWIGSQVDIENINEEAGFILKDSNGKPILKNNGEMYTALESIFQNGNTTPTRVKLDSVVKEFEATTSLVAYSFVEIFDDGKVRPANYNTTGKYIIGIVLEDANIGDIVSVQFAGVFENPNWNFQTIGKDVYVDSNGNVTDTDPFELNNTLYPARKLPIGKVLDKHSILLINSRRSSYELDLLNVITSQTKLSTPNDLGSVKLNIPAVDPNEPIVVGNNDPRLSDSRQPLSHTHTAVEIATNSSPVTLGSNLDEKLSNVDVELIKRLKESDNINFTGAISYSGPITNDNSLVTKKYLEDSIVGVNWIDPIIGTNLVSSDQQNDPFDIHPTDLKNGDIYIAGTTLTSVNGNTDWNTFIHKDILSWVSNTQKWIKIGNLDTNTNPVRLGVALTTTNINYNAELLGRKNQIYIYDNTTGNVTFQTTVKGNAAYVDNPSAVLAGYQLNFNGNKWTIIANTTGISLVPVNNITLVGNQIDVKQYSQGGTIDASSLRGKTDTDFATVTHNHNTLYAPINHNHSSLYANIAHNHDTIYLLKNEKAQDSEKLDGLDSTQFLRKDINQNVDVRYTFGTHATTKPGIVFTQEGYVGNTTDWTNKQIHGGANGIYGGRDGGGVLMPNNIMVQTWWGFGVSNTIDGQPVPRGETAFSVDARNGNVYCRGNYFVYDGTQHHTVWHQGNDGEGSGLDADYLRGKYNTISEVPNTIVQRDQDGDVSCRLLRSTYEAQTIKPHDGAFIQFKNATGANTDNYIRSMTRRASIDWHKEWGFIEQMVFSERRDSPYIPANQAYVPYDNGFWYASQGYEVLNRDIVPRYSTNAIMITGVVNVELDGTGDSAAVGIFLGGGNEALFISAARTVPGATLSIPFQAFQYNITAGQPFSVKVRLGTFNNQPLRLNTVAAYNKGNRIITSMTITESWRP